MVNQSPECWLAGILTYPQALFSEVYSLFYGKIKVMKKPGCSCGGIRCSLMTFVVLSWFSSQSFF